MDKKCEVMFCNKSKLSVLANCCGKRGKKHFRTGWYILTNDDLTGLGGFGDLVGTAHLWVADSTQDEDDEAGAVPVVLRGARLMFLPCAEEKDDEEEL